MTVNNRRPIPLHWRNLMKVKRYQLGISQRELAEMIGGGMTQVQVSLVERGDRDPLVSTVLRIFEALGMVLEPMNADDLEEPHLEEPS